jgi:hypothetical protein
MKILYIAISVAHVPLGLWCFMRVGGVAWFAEQTSQVLMAYAVLGVAIPSAAAFLTGLLAPRQSTPYRSIPFYFATLPYCAPYLALGIAAVPEAITKTEYRLFSWILLGLATAVVTALAYATPSIMRKRQNKASGAYG